jgi:hypothetical protein
MARLGHTIEKRLEDRTLLPLLEQAQLENPWFTPENTRNALHRLARHYLAADALERWTAPYAQAIAGQPARTVALVMAGNIPMAGFHDLLTAALCGHYIKAKLSARDAVLMKFLIGEMTDREPEWEEKIERVEEGILAPFDAIIATGSNNTGRYFDYYFRKYPSIIRRNRNGVAVLQGDETDAQLRALGHDLFEYFGLGCRSVSKLFVPQGYDFAPLLEANRLWKPTLFASLRYKNNLDYVRSLWLLNDEAHLDGEYLLLKESTVTSSPIAALHFEYYQDEADLQQRLEAIGEEIQVLVSTKAKAPAGFEPVAPGEAQRPGLADYADGVDTLDFLSRLG